LQGEEDIRMAVGEDMRMVRRKRHKDGVRRRRHKDGCKEKT
jgi:hypothetical protein